MNTQTEPHEHPELAFLHEIGERIAASDPLHLVLRRVVEFISEVVLCDSCFVYVVENNDLILKASKNPHAEVIGRLRLRMGQGITGWVAEHRKPVAIRCNAYQDPRFRPFSELPEDRYEAFLSVPVLCRDKVVGVINVQHRQPHNYGQRETQLIATIGFLVGTEVERAHIEAEQVKFADLSEARKLVEQAALILQRDLTLVEDEARAEIAKLSRREGKSMKEVASAVLLYEELRRNANRSS
jgi:uroporphyrinogen-III synthase